ncbi:MULTISPECIES: SH3 domain-containing protein [unclassified Streptococcus]|uniref:SH3 domain-containing protein n=1 Tax=unclassified Streptococcus TaxID=2608887 RepID=UPI0027D1F7A8|nr:MULTISPECIES: SH3 domain-containing protein [unclassified Streptococcus]
MERKLSTQLIIEPENLAYYDVGMTVNYDKVLEADGYRWISYLSIFPRESPLYSA